MIATETDKQRKFIEKIADTICVDYPKPMSKQQASEWINDHINEFNFLNSDDPLIYALIDDELGD